MWRALPLIPFLAILAGCTPPPVYVSYWARPGAPPDAFAAASEECQARAFSAFPPMSLGQEGVFLNNETFCQPTSGGTNCMLINPGYLPQARSENDQNLVPRAQSFERCMMAGGWRPAATPDEGAMASETPFPPSAAARRRAAALCDDIFRVHRDPKRMAWFNGDRDRCVTAESWALDQQHPSGLR
jgi:hypothetical protein